MSTIQVQVCSSCIILKGTILGISGNTGSSTGPHLHFSVYNDNLGTVFSQKVVDPYGWIHTSPPVWAANQRNSLWVTYPYAGENSNIYPSGVALPFPTPAPIADDSDDLTAYVINFPSTCSWTSENNGNAQNGQWHYIRATSSSSPECKIKWWVPDGLAPGIYDVYARIPPKYSESQYTDGAIYKISYTSQIDYVTPQQRIVWVSQREVIRSRYPAELDHRIYIGQYYFQGTTLGNFTENITIGNVVFGTPLSEARVVADQISFHLVRQMYFVRLPLISRHIPQMNLSMPVLSGEPYPPPGSTPTSQPYP